MQLKVQLKVDIKKIYIYFLRFCIDNQRVFLEGFYIYIDRNCSYWRVYNCIQGCLKLSECCMKDSKYNQLKLRELDA